MVLREWGPHAKGRMEKAWTQTISQLNLRGTVSISSAYNVISDDNSENEYGVQQYVAEKDPLFH